MDRHEAASSTPELAAERHACDLDIQAKYGVRYLTYWYQQGKPTSFCLVEAPNAGAASAVHMEAHGRTASQIIEVDRSSVDAFLGPIREPARGEAWEDVSWRTIVCIDPASASLADSLWIRDSLQDRGGHELSRREGKIMCRYASTPAALECALAVQRFFSPLASVFAERSVLSRVGIHRSEPVTHYLDLFGEAVDVAASLCDRAAPGEVLVSGEVRDACADLGYRFAAQSETSIEGAERQTVFRLEGRDSFASEPALPTFAMYAGSLSPRELEVLQQIARGRTNQEIAEALFISLNTVATHVRSIFNKTQAANRAEAAIYALRHRLV